jgi:hypothetical protein
MGCLVYVREREKKKKKLGNCEHATSPSRESRNTRHVHNYQTFNLTHSTPHIQVVESHHHRKIVEGLGGKKKKLGNCEHISSPSRESRNTRHVHNYQTFNLTHSTPHLPVVESHHHGKIVEGLGGKKEK